MMQKILTPFLVLLTLGLWTTVWANEPDISILDGTKFTVGNTKIQQIKHTNTVKIILSDAGAVEKNKDHIVLKLQDGYRIMGQYQLDKDYEQKTLYTAVIKIDKGGKIATVKGTLTTAFPVALSLLNHEHADVRTLRLQDIQGSIDTEDALTVTMQKTHSFGYVTYMKQGDTVLSGGANLFYAGRYRFAEKGATIGIHSHGDPDGNTITSNQYDHYGKLYKSMGLTPELYELEKNIPNQKMHYLSHAEMIKYNIINVNSKQELEQFLNITLP